MNLLISGGHFSMTTLSATTSGTLRDVTTYESQCLGDSFGSSRGFELWSSERETSLWSRRRCAVLSKNAN